MTSEDDAAPSGRTEAEELEDLGRLAIVEPGKPRAKKFRLYKLDDLDQMPPKEFLFEGLIGPGDLMMLHGASCAGKSWIAIDMAARASAGLPAFDDPELKALRPLNVLYVTEEGFEALRDRFAGVLDSLRAEAAARERIRVCDRVPNVFDPEDPESGLAHLLAELDEAVKHGFKPEIVIVDTLADAAPGARDGATEDWAPIMQRLKRLALDRRLAIVVVHHNRKMDDEYRGPVAIKAKLDIAFNVTGEGDERKIVCTKAKHRRALPERRFDLIEVNRERAKIEFRRPESGPQRKTSLLATEVERAIEYLHDAGIDCEEKAVSIAQLKDRWQYATDERAFRNALVAKAEDPCNAVQSVNKPTLDKNGKPNRLAIHFYWREKG